MDKQKIKKIGDILAFLTGFSGAIGLILEKIEFILLWFVGIAVLFYLSKKLDEGD